MKKQSLFVAVAAIMMAACSETDNLSVQNVAQQQSETAVGFDTYMGRSTRAGAVGEITTKEELQIDNFGVFAYYHNGTEYPADWHNDLTATTPGKFKPDFMWNQKVEYDGDNWFYFPVKYWPNESATGADYVDAADPTNNHATTTGAASPDKVSFFAYAPYVEANAKGAVTPNADGIISIWDPTTSGADLNTILSDPYIQYQTSTDPLKTVDLLWGVVPAYKTKYSTVVPAAAEQTVTAGKPNYNLWKQTTDERIMFQFKHALAKLTLDVVGFFDDVPENGAHSTTDPGNAGDASDQSANNVAKDTKIVIEYVKLSTEKYPSKSVLNLNNYQEANKPNWVLSQTKAAGNLGISFDISGSQLANLIRYRTPSAPERGYAEQPRGVTKDAVALLANDASQEAFFGIIPQEKTANMKWTAEIKYHVFTKDANLENGYSEITNVIKKNDIDMTFEPGKHYTLRLRLGMTSVKFDATVEDWVDGGSTPADLPINVAVKSLSGMELKYVPCSASGTDVYNGYIPYGPTDLATFTIQNCATEIQLDKLKARLENGTTDDAVSTSGAVLESDVDWIAYDHNGKFVASENRTSADRKAHVWAVYGGVKSDPFEITQSASKLTFDLKWKEDPTTDPKVVAAGVTGPWNYTLAVRYENTTSGSSTTYIDVTNDANTNGTFNHANWITIDRSAKSVSTTGKYENETTDRTSTISLSYGGDTSNTITLTQSHK